LVDGVENALAVGSTAPLIDRPSGDAVLN